MITQNKNINSSIPEALEQLKSGRPIIVVDDMDRENEGDLIQAAEFADADAVNFMVQRARGLVCIAMTGRALDRLKIPMMVQRNGHKSKFNSPFTISVEASSGVTTGISTADRARTIKILADEVATPDDVIMPGHIFPLRAQDGGVLVRRGHTEAGIDLMQLAGLAPAAVICEIMNDDGSMSRRDQLVEFAAHNDLVMITIDELVEYRTRSGDKHLSGADRAQDGALLVVRSDSARLPTRYGVFSVTAYRDQSGHEHLSLSMGLDSNPDSTSTPVQEATLVRLHSECLTGDVLGSLRCDCGQQLDSAMAQIASEGTGILLYMRQEGRGIGLVNKIQAYSLQDKGMDTVEANIDLGYEADQRDYAIAAAILTDRSISKIKLMTNNPRKIADLEANGIQVVERVSLEMPAHPENQDYLRTKRDKLDHRLSSL